MDNQKPIPKTQREISISQQPIEGNPNNISQNVDRANQNSFKGDNTKPFSVNIQDLDNAILYYFQNVIKPFVVQNNERLEVPIIYGSPEKWKSFQRDGFYRDAKGVIMNPLIMFKQDSIEKNRTISNKIDANNPHNYGIFGKVYSPKNNYDNFSVLTNQIPEKTFYSIVIPDYLTVTYSCIISTYYIEQLNKIVEAIEYASDSYWGDPERFKFQARIDSFTTATEYNDGTERIVRSNFNIKLYGYIIPETIQKDLTSMKKFRNKTVVVITEEIK